MLNPSQILSFLDQQNNFVVHFLEGQKLVQELILLQPLCGQGLQYFRDSLLSLVPMIKLLKNGENLCLSIDSDEPFFRLKIEMNFAGEIRALLLPEGFDLFPSLIKGRARLVKGQPENKAPYVSIIELEGLSYSEIINEILLKSYQVEAKIIIGKEADQSLMVLKLPGNNEDAQDLDHYIHNFKVNFLPLLNKDIQKEEEIINFFESKKLDYLKTNPIKIKCQCSKNKMIQNVALLEKSLINDLLEEQKPLEIKCDFCKTVYMITPQEVVTIKNS